MSSGDGCSFGDRLKKETCRSVDTYFPTQISDSIGAGRCERRQRLVVDGVEGQCKSEEEYVDCKPGCKPLDTLTRPVSFKCAGNASGFVSLASVPTACVSV